MAEVFESILRLSIGACVSILIVCLARLLLRRSPKMISYALWAVVLFNLVCPLRWELPILPSDAPVLSAQKSAGQSVVSNTQSDYELKPVNPAANPEYTQQSEIIPAYGGEVTRNVRSNITLMDILLYIWLAGAGMMLIFGVISYLSLKRRIALAVRREDGIYETDAVDSPFVLGIIKPRIYLPTGLTGMHRDYILAHERTHLRRLDYLVLIAAYLVLAAHWFNPLVWLAYFLMRRDMESSCDEAVLRSESANVRRDYAAALIAFADTKGRLPVPLAFGEESVKSRVKNVLSYRRISAAGKVVACLVSLVVITGCTATLGEAPGESAEPTAVNENAEPTIADESAEPTIADKSAEPTIADKSTEPTAAETPIPTQGETISDPGGSDPLQLDGVEIFPGIDSEVPELVLQDAVQYVKVRMHAVNTPSNVVQDGAVVDGARLDKLELVYTYEWSDVTDNIYVLQEGTQVEVYRFEWRYHTTTPDKFILVGGMDMSSDGWLLNTYPNSNYLIYSVLGGERRGLGTFFCNDDFPGGKLFTADLQRVLSRNLPIATDTVQGYITDFDVVQHTFLFDEFEWVTDEARAKELGVDMPGGFYIYNAEERWDTYSYSDVWFNIIDYSQEMITLEVDELRFAEQVQQFEAYDAPGMPGMPAVLTYSDDKLILIEQKYVP
jgi:beta-lactamase regulating signal transducer with metallopeptidase domain